jgi:hypothetical protein
LILLGVGCLAGSGNIKNGFEGLPEWIKTMGEIAILILLIMYFATPKETGLEVICALILIVVLLLA